MMVESEAKELSEDVMLGAVKYGHEQMQSIINIDEFITEVGVTKLSGIQSNLTMLHIQYLKINIKIRFPMLIRS